MRGNFQRDPKFAPSRGYRYMHPEHGLIDVISNEDSCHHFRIVETGEYASGYELTESWEYVGDTIKILYTQIDNLQTRLHTEWDRYYAKATEAAGYANVMQELAEANGELRKLLKQND